jgi:ATP phosphoribosyltransferase
MKDGNFMLRIAVPNKGSLSEAAGALLHEAGYRRRSDRELLVVDPESGVELFYLRPRDIAVYVGSGRLDIGITGRDLLLDSQAEAEELLALGFGRSSFRFAGRPGSGSTLEDLKGKRIATSYPGIVQSHLDRAGVPAEVVKLDGAVEIAIQLGVADVIADVVDSGATLRQAGADRPVDPGVRGGGDPAPGRRAGAGRGAVPAPDAGRAGGPQVRADGL